MRKTNRERSLIIQSSEGFMAVAVDQIMSVAYKQILNTDGAKTWDS